MDCNEMETVMILNWVAVIICLSVRESCAMCVDGNNEVVEGELGGNVTISCEAPSRCDHILWDKEYHRSTIDSSHESTNQTSSNGNPRKPSSKTFSITSDAFGIHSCWCFKNGTKYGNSPVCTVTLTPICQSEVNIRVKVNEKTLMYNSGQRSSSEPRFLNVTEGDKVTVRCPKKASAGSNCHKVKEVNRKDSDNYRYKLTISLRHNLCSIACSLNHICNVNITFYVSNRNEPTQSPPGPTEFPVAILVSILAVFLIIVTFAFCFCKFFLRSRSKSRSNKQIKPCYPSNRSRYRHDQDNETIKLSSTKCLQEHPNVPKHGACDTEGFYYDIKNTKEYEDIIDTEGSSHQPANLLTTEASVSRDFKFAFQTSKKKDVENCQSQKCYEIATGEERVKGESGCGPVNELGDQQGRLAKSSGNGTGKLEVFYAVLENDQDC